MVEWSIQDHPDIFALLVLGILAHFFEDLIFFLQWWRTRKNFQLKEALTSPKKKGDKIGNDYRKLSKRLPSNQSNAVKDLILPIYLYFFRVEWVLSCFYFFLVCYMARHTISLYEYLCFWSPGWAVSVALGIHAGMSDGILLFLVSPGVGKDDLKRCINFALYWTAFNIFILSAINVLGNLLTDLEPGVSPAQLWSPVFLHCCIWLCFNLYICFVPLPKSLSGVGPSAILHGGISTYSHTSVSPQSTAQTSLNSDAPAQDSYSRLMDSGEESCCLVCEPERFIQRDSHQGGRLAWRYYASFCIFFSLAAVVLQILNYMTGNEKTRRVLEWGVIVGNFCEHIILYIVLLLDSSHWRKTWQKCLLEIKSDSMARLSGSRSRQASLASVTSSSQLSFALVDFADMTMEKALGAGAYGAVYQGYALSHPGEKLAIKFIIAKEMNSEAVITFLREVRFLATLQHPCIVSAKGASISPPHFAIITELIDGPSLTKQLDHGDIIPSKAIHIALCIAKALKYLHSKGVLHRDLKAANILLGHLGQVKVCDFGLSKQVTTGSSTTGSKRAPQQDWDPYEGQVVGSLPYMAPEILQGRDATEASDIFSFGILLWELTHSTRVWNRYRGVPTDGFLPPQRAQPSQQRNSERSGTRRDIGRAPTIQPLPRGVMERFRVYQVEVAGRKARPGIQKHLPSRLTRLITACWAHDPQLRPTPSEMVESLALEKADMVRTGEWIEVVNNPSMTAAADDALIPRSLRMEEEQEVNEHKVAAVAPTVATTTTTTTEADEDRKRQAADRRSCTAFSKGPLPAGDSATASASASSEYNEEQDQTQTDSAQEWLDEVDFHSISLSVAKHG